MSSLRRLGVLWALAVTSMAGLMISVTLLIAGSGAAPVKQGESRPLPAQSAQITEPSGTSGTSGTSGMQMTCPIGPGNCPLPLAEVRQPRAPLPVTGVPAGFLLVTGNALIGLGLLLIRLAGRTGSFIRRDRTRRSRLGQGWR